MIFMNNKWKVKNRDETILRLIDDKQILLEKKIQEWVESGKQYPKIMAKFSRYIEKREQNDVINAIKEDIKLMLYNNRNMIIENVETEELVAQFVAPENVELLKNV